MHSSNLISRKQVEVKSGYSCASIYNKMKEGLFPKPVKIGFASRWVEDEVDAFNRARIAGWSDSEIRRLIRAFETSRVENAPSLQPPHELVNTDSGSETNE